jgi:hypothetical protein
MCFNVDVYDDKKSIQIKCYIQFQIIKKKNFHINIW